MTTDISILVIDDEPQIRHLLEITLSVSGYKVHNAPTGKQGIALCASLQPQAVILDLGLPDIDGLAVLRKLREWYTSPVIILSARNAEEYIVEALDNGADDYLSKPFRTGELLARIRVAIRRNQLPCNNQVLLFGSLSVDIVSHVVKKNDELIKLTSTEFSLLALFAQNEGRVLTHQYILRQIWGMGYVEQTQYLRVFVAQLRKKIEDNPAKPKILITESGIGYRFG